jgi:hypothetical protein
MQRDADQWLLVRDSFPPLRPASEAKFLFCENERFSDGTLLPPLLAISRCFSGVIDAKPRRPVLVPSGIASSLAVAVHVRLTLRRSCRSGHARKNLDGPFKLGN